MPEEPQDKKKTKLVRILQGVEEKAPQLEGLGQDIIETARRSWDFASCIRDAIKAVPNDSYLTEPVWARVAASWEAWNENADRLLGSLPTEANSFRATAGTAIFTTSSGDVFKGILALDLPSGSRSIVEKAGDRFGVVANGIPLFREVKAGMIRLGLERRRGTDRTPVEHLEDAQTALARPIAEDAGPVPVLIAVRGSVEATLAALLARRPTQEPAPHTTEKIASIGGQCSRPGLAPDHFMRLGADAHSLLDRLSDAKQKNFSRAEVMDQYNQALLFLQAFLDSLDETRLRQ
jgi:hypothetical protein